MSKTGEQIKKRRKQLGMSADELAEKLGVSRSTIFRYEKGDIDKVPAEYAKPLADALCTTPAYLMGWEDPEDEPTGYYLNQDTAQYADFLLHHPEYQVLFDASRKVKPEDIEKALTAL